LWGFGSCVRVLVGLLDEVKREHSSTTLECTSRAPYFLPSNAGGAFIHSEEASHIYYMRHAQCGSFVAKTVALPSEKSTVPWVAGISSAYGNTPLPPDWSPGKVFLNMCLAVLASLASTR
jgi:hypothetical protein